jgi:hypothetical protein
MSWPKLIEEEEKSRTSAAKTTFIFEEIDIVK